MTTSDLISAPPTTLYVWIWLPDATEPVVCGRLDELDNGIWFTYAQSYKARENAVSVYEPELPLDADGPHTSADGDRLPLCIDDTMPDSWGRRLVNHRLGAGYAELPELTYLAASASDRIGALDVQLSPTEYVPRDSSTPSLEDLADAARLIEEGMPLHAHLEQALLHGTSIGGARPKALVTSGDRHLIAKFSSTTDTYPVVAGEYVAMTLARRCGLNVAAVSLVKAHERDVLIVERFDRPGGKRRQRVVSALTVLGLNTFPSGRYATYAALADAIRRSFRDPDETLRELFGRISFNILSGNTDDHGRNHAALVHEDGLVLSPAYDICPQARTGSQANQAMAYGPNDERVAQIASLVDVAHVYHLERTDAQRIVDEQVDVIRGAWDDVCEGAHLTADQRSTFFGRQFLNPSVFEH
jgi:serine/threonine-protein kinase HipA